MTFTEFGNDVGGAPRLSQVPPLTFVIPTELGGCRKAVISVSVTFTVCTCPWTMLTVTGLGVAEMTG